MRTPRTIAVVTGTRAEYGLLFWLLKEIANDSELRLQLLVTGSHLSEEFGLTRTQIEKDGFKIDHEIPILTNQDSSTAIARSTAQALVGFAEAFRKNRPDIVVVLGDRYEIFAAAQAAMLSRIPIAHIHGGELTEGAIDDAIRHSLTKMAHLHFAAAEPYRKRILQLGETPDRVFCFGAPGTDQFTRAELLSQEEIEKVLGLSFERPVFLVTFHPVTLDSQSPLCSLDELLRALDGFSDANLIITKSNADEGGRAINQRLEEYAQKQPDRIKCFASLGQKNYLSAMKYCAAVVGNSSSGIIEAPFFKVPTINVGDRQKGRLRAPSIIDVREDAEEIAKAVKKALSADFQLSLGTVQSPYGAGNVSYQIKETLKRADFATLLKKKFHDQ